MFTAMKTCPHLTFIAGKFCFKDCHHLLHLSGHKKMTSVHHFKGLPTFLLTCICLMAGGLLVKRDVRMSHDVTSDRHTKEKIR